MLSMPKYFPIVSQFLVGQKVMGAEQVSGPQTNEERSSRTRARLLDATVECLMEKGYASTTTTDVVKRAGVSRGALAHHFPNKAELVAAASVHLIRRRYEFYCSRMSQGQENLNLNERLEAMYREYDRWFPATIEFMVAARTDDNLNTLFSEEMEPYTRELTELSMDEFSEFDNHESSLMIGYILGCFIRGLCLERIVNSEALVEQIFAEFSKIIEVYARHGS